MPIHVKPWGPACGRRSAAMLLMCTLAGAAQAGPTFPPRKAGLWEMRMAMEGQSEPIVTSHCVDQHTDKAMQEYGSQQPRMNRKACKEETRNEAGKMVVHREVCQDGQVKVSTHVVLSGDFNSQYTMQSITTYDPPQPGRAKQDMRAEARWMGACAAGQRPGDMIMPGGMKMNIVDLMKAGSKVPRGQPR